MHTEEEARELWCPFARVCATASNDPAASAHTGYNRVHVQDEPDTHFDAASYAPKIAHCIASQCMAWRWQVETFAQDGQCGYCGLAGQP